MGAMTIENGTAIVLAYVLVSMTVIIAFLLAAFVIGWSASVQHSGSTIPLRLVTLAAGVIDEPLPAAARLSRRTLSVVTATSNEERVPETPP